jgi:hypothetical protein
MKTLYQLLYLMKDMINIFIIICLLITVRIEFNIQSVTIINFLIVRN